MASHQWVPPLPPGYEARWDPNQRAYFFINHNTKATSWVDPRFSQQAQPQNQSYQTTAQRTQMQGQHRTNRSVENREPLLQYQNNRHQVINNPKTDGKRGGLPNMHIDYRQGAKPNTHTKQGTIPNPDKMQGAIPNAHNSQGAIPNAHTSQQVIPYGHNLQGTIPKADNRQGAIPNAHTKQGAISYGQNLQGTIPKADNRQGAIPNAHTKQEAMSYGQNLHGTIPKADNRQGAIPNAHNMQGAIPKADNRQGAIPNAHTSQETIPYGHNLQGTIPKADNRAILNVGTVHSQRVMANPGKSQGAIPNVQVRNMQRGNFTPSLGKIQGDVNVPVSNSDNKHRVVVGLMPSSAKGQGAIHNGYLSIMPSTDKTQRAIPSVENRQMVHVMPSSNQRQGAKPNVKDNRHTVTEMPSSNKVHEAIPSSNKSHAIVVMPSAEKKHEAQGIDIRQEALHLMPAADKSQRALNQSGQFGGSYGQETKMNTMFKQYGGTTTIQSSGTESDSDDDTNFDHLFGSTAEEGKVDLLKVQELRQSFPDAPEDLISQLLKTNNNVVVKVGNKLFEMGYKRAAGVHHPPPRGNDIQERLAAMFPDADHELMTELLEACGGDEKEARETLERVGYKPVFPATHRNPSAQGGRARSPAKSPTPRQTTPTKKTSPSKTNQQSHQRARTPDKPQLTEGQKTQLMSKLQREFTSTDKTVIEMAFQVTDWDETRARSVLKGMANTDTTSRPSTSQSRPSTSYSRTRSPSPTPVVSPASLEPVAMFDDEPSRPSTSTSSHRPGSTPAYKKSSEYYSRPSTGASSYSKIGSNVSSYTSQVKSSKTGSSSSGGSSSKSRTKPAPLSTQQTKNVTDHRSKHPVTGQPTRRPEQYVSQYRTEARGPDPSYHVGPNKALLLTEYTRASGPNMALREGPDPSRVQGSQGAMGPDRALCCGPQHQLAMGPNTNARQPAYV